MAPLKPLCEYCSKVVLNIADSTIESADTGHEAWIMGSGKRIKSSDCPFCQLIVRAFQQLNKTGSNHKHQTLTQMNEVRLDWFHSMAPGNRGGFTVDGGGLRNWICVAVEPGLKPQNSRTRYLKPQVDADVDVSQLSKWISACMSAHSGECSLVSSSFRRTFPGLSVVRFIDVEQSCLVELLSVPQYVALSYVWGEVTNIRLTTANRQVMLKPGAIEEAWHMIPRTIQDAIELVRRLGAKYLWVDTLCLLQNDQRDLALGIRVMDQIYETSWLVIIAACGHNADWGLPGIREESRTMELIASDVTEKISLGLYTPLDCLLSNSVYSSRAWT